MARPRQISDEQICAAMRRCVADHGPGVSLDVVAKKLHVTSPALLKRYGSRRGLMLAALRPPDNALWYQSLSQGPDSRPLQTQLAEIISRTLASTVEAMPCMMALRESGIPLAEIFPKGTPPPLLRSVQALTKWLARGRRLGLVGDHNHETTATALLGAITVRGFSAHLLKRVWSKQKQHEYATELSELFTRALSPALSFTHPLAK